MTPDATPGFSQRYEALERNVSSAVLGKREPVRLALTCLLAGGHLLVEDVPGVGKTSLARAVAASISGSWHRIQFTPDLLPSDVTGVTIWNQGRGTFEFHPGAVFANLVLADEINRASPKTQSALLEVMEEQRVTVDAITHDVPRPFMVVATQNPVEMDGTYRLPEAQLDRFLLRMAMGYPDPVTEALIVTGRVRGTPVDGLRPVVSLADVAVMITWASRVATAPALVDYVVRLVGATRTHPEVRLGVSPRGSLGLTAAARAWAATDGRAYATPDDVKALAVPVLAHRMVLTPDAEVRGRIPAQVVGDLLASTPVPEPAVAAAAR